MGSLFRAQEESPKTESAEGGTSTFQSNTQDVIRDIHWQAELHEETNVLKK